MVKRRNPQEEQEEYEAILQRLGVTPVDRLRWAVRRVQESRRSLTAGDREDLRAELAVFTTGMERGGGAEWTNGKLDRPAAEEAFRVLGELERIIQAAVKHEHVVIARRSAELSLSWDGRRFMLWDDDDDADWSLRARKVLAHLLIESGHLLRECPAPAPRDKDMTCSTWFVATRPRQRYCSTKCGSRAGTQGHRRRQSTSKKKGA